MIRYCNNLKSLPYVAISILAISGSAFSQNEIDPSEIDNAKNVSMRHLNLHPGKGSKGQTIYNKIQVPGKVMSIAETPLYNSMGQQIATARASSVGYVNGVKDGGINAAGICTLIIEGKPTECVYMFSINIKKGGRMSGWAVLSSLTPSVEISELQYNIKAKVDTQRSTLEKTSYQRKVVIDVTLPKEAAEWYLMANRAASKSQGKAKYYFTKRGHLYGLFNIPESGQQRYGVSCDMMPIGTVFYQDENQAPVAIPVFQPDSSEKTKYVLNLVYGYFVNNNGEKRYCWTNLDCLQG